MENASRYPFPPSTKL